MKRSLSKKVVWKLLAVLSLGASGPAAAQELPAARAADPVDGGAHFGLEQALAALRARHPLLQMARASTQAAAGDAKAVRLWSNPTISSTWALGVANSSYDPVGAWTWQISQFVELANAPGQRGKAADYLTHASERDVDYLYFQLSCDLELSLIDLMAAERSMSNAQAASDLLAKARTIIVDRVKAGAAPKYDGDRISLAFAQIQADLSEARAAKLRARAEFARAVGPGVDNLQGEPSYQLETRHDVLSLGVAKGMLKSRPDVQAAELRAASADASISAARRGVFPGVNLQLGAGIGQAPGQIDFMVGLAAPLPVVDRGQGTVMAAEARRDAADSYAHGIVELEARRLEGLVAEAEQRQRALDEFESTAVLSSDEMLREAQAGYIAGNFSVLELVDAYTTWRDARARHVALLASARRVEVELRRSVGPERGEASSKPGQTAAPH